MVAATSPPAQVIGRYRLYDPIASGGMATVYFGRLLGPVGFSRTVAIKRLHPQFASNPDFVSMFLDEARLAGRIRHPNVVPTLDIVALADELFLVMEYVQGEPLGSLVNTATRAGKKMPIAYAVAIAAAALRGLHAAHDATDELGQPLGIVHRDISPQNILVGVDGVSRVLDFGVAKAAGRLQISREGQLKGKMAYMPPEQIRSEAIDRRADVYAMGAVLWECLTARRLFPAENDVAALAKVLEGSVALPSHHVPEIPSALDAIVMRALSRKPADRFDSARDMARALEAAVPLVAVAEIGEWVETMAAAQLGVRAQMVSRIESDSRGGDGSPLAALRASSPEIETRVGVVPEVSLAATAATAATNNSEISGVSGVGQGPSRELAEPTESIPPHFEARFAPRRVLALAGAALGGLFVVGILARLASPAASNEAAAPASSSSATASVPVATAEPKSPEPPAPPPPAPSATVTTSAPSAMPSAAPAVVATATRRASTDPAPNAAPEAQRRPAPAARALDSVLDSRK
jgi:serine/threonine-protein kinase